MKKYKVLLVSIEAADQKKLTALQQKLNQWITIGVLKKYDVYSTSTHIFFNICKIKEQGE